LKIAWGPGIEDATCDVDVGHRIAVKKKRVLAVIENECRDRDQCGEESE
jgi:hypothetical protein